MHDPTRLRALCLSAVCLIASLGAVGLPGCSGTPRDGDADEADAPRLPVGAWRLVAIEGERFADPLPEGVRTPTLRIDTDGSFSGIGGVNRFSGTAETGAWQAREIVFGPMAVTRMAGTAPAMMIEGAYLGAVGAVRRFSFDDGMLVLTGEAGELLRFAPGG